MDLNLKEYEDIKSRVLCFNGEKLQHPEDYVNKIICGDCLEVMRGIPDNSVDCVITSPPYWGLRDYGQETEMIWDGDKNCEHKWETHHTPARGGHSRPENPPSVGSNKAEMEKGISIRFGYDSNFCSKCGAWRGQLGLEPTFKLYIKHLVDIFDEVKRILKPTGTLWVNLGDSYATHSGGMEQLRKLGSGCPQYGQVPYKFAGVCQDGKKNINIPSKSLVCIPERFIIEMIDRGWILRNKIIWHKNNCMPSSASDRFTVDFENIFFFVKQQKYYFEQQFESHKRLWDESNGGNLSSDSKYYDNAGILQKKKHSGEYPLPNPLGRNKRCVWNINTKGFPEAHFAVFPEALIEPIIQAGCPEFVCSKCGAGRTKIEEHDLIQTRPGINGKTTEHKEIYGNLNKRLMPANSRIVGYSDCGCNAGFEGGIVLDPFVGSGTVPLVALKHNRKFIGIEINPEYVKMAEDRIFMERNQLKLL